MTDPTPTPLDLDLSTEAKVVHELQIMSQHGWKSWWPRRAQRVMEVALNHITGNATERDALVAEVRRLRAVIEAAPHDDVCLSQRPTPMPCTCWKRDALAGVTP